MKLSERKFGELEGQVVTEFCLENDHGVRVRALDYGGIVTETWVPDAKGDFVNVSLGFATLDEYLAHSPYFGALVGRVAGRIGDARFELDGKTYQLEKNEGENILHGGPDNFSKRMWDAERLETVDEIGVVFSLTSLDGDNGFPGNLDVRVTYTLNNANEWRIKYEAKSDAATVFNPTNHVYFNLTGDVEKLVLDQELQMRSSRFVALDAASIPTGELVDVTGTVFDFREPRALRDGGTSEHPQNVIIKNGYDHAFVLEHEAGEPDARLVDPDSGRVVEMRTDCDSVVVYTGNQLSGKFAIDGVAVPKYAGVTMETQGLPDSMNHEGFGSAVIQKDELFESETVFTFKTL
ncbi:galactose mutarotase [Listeria sp. SHR_NRA_18]|uniref:aldose epimerase family protein n=1 Tax=Listeria sp. SHR_NRA_18 TaxID=2269046 RepID=UPI00051DBD1C|nr:aldose epimerase family protein [Listeria sp. SHR_NRA_18]KGL43256.1 aldose epimerase [Listeriaceae bacterium FSL A5-0209]RQW65868.1 galactose mutarotase [Listeria sp. SHR_NRA_18]